MAAEGFMEAESDSSLPDAEACRLALQRILGSRSFQVSERRRNFLHYVVDEALAGRGGRLKAYSIGMAVFQRGPDFDPQNDPIVRIEAGRLRAALERYYAGEGAADPVRIELPRGGYVPRFTVLPEVSGKPATDSPPQDPARPASPRVLRGGMVAAVALAVVGVALGLWLLRGGESTSPPKGERGITILVGPFEADGDPARTDIARGLTREVIADLTRFNDLVVFGPETSLSIASGAGIRQEAAALGARYAIEGALSVVQDKYRLSVALIEVAGGRYIWSREFTGTIGPEDFFAAEDRIASEIVRTLAQPYGIIFENQVKEERARPAGSLTSYECVLGFNQYWRSPSPEGFSKSRLCLEEAVAKDPGYANAYSALALIYGDAVRYGIGKDQVPPEPLSRALDLARRAVELEPRATHGYKALLLIHWLRHETEDSFAAARTGLELNPNDTELLADLGTRYCVVGRWDEGYPMLEEALARNPGLSDYYRIVTFLRLYKDGKYEEALAEAKRIHLPRLLDSHLAVAAAQAQLGNPAEAAEAVAKVLEIDPAFPEHAVAYLKNRNLYPELSAKLIEGWRLAGMAIPEDGL